MKSERPGAASGAPTQPLPAIWLVEDDPTCQDIVREALRDRCILHTFGAIHELETAAADASDVALIIADVFLPDASFVTWLASDAGRALAARVPFLVVSSVDDADTIREAFRGGAVDFLSKPFGRAELRVKIERALGAAVWPPSTKLRASGEAAIELDALRMTVRRAGESVELTAKEMQVLALLWNAPSRTLTRDELHDAIWRGCHVGRKTLDVHLSRLRRKLARVQLDVRALPRNVVALVEDAAPAAPP